MLKALAAEGQQPLSALSATSVVDVALWHIAGYRRRKSDGSEARGARASKCMSPVAEAFDGRD